MIGLRSFSQNVRPTFALAACKACRLGEPWIRSASEAGAGAVQPAITAMGAATANARKFKIARRKTYPPI